MEFGKRHDTTDTTDFCPRQLIVTDLLRACRLCCGLVVDLLRGSRQRVTDLQRENWCNEFWPLHKKLERLSFFSIIFLHR